jgi:hypothetical protein
MDAQAPSLPPSSPCASFFAPLPKINLRIGITGRRKLSKPEAVCAAIKSALCTIEGWFDGSPYTLEVLSQLADGTDRLAVRCIMDRVHETYTCPDPSNPSGVKLTQNPPQSVNLNTILPMPAEVYCHTFIGEENSSYDSPASPENPSVKEFYELLSLSAAPRIIPPVPDALAGNAAETYKNQGKRQDAYRRAGEFIVNNCDLLLVVWDGVKDTRLGSAYQLYKFAGEHARSVVLIDANTGDLEWHLSADDLAAHLYFYRIYSGEICKLDATASAVQSRYQSFLKDAREWHLSTDGFEELNTVLRPFIRARDLASHYQSLYNNWGIVGYSCAALAVCVAAILSHTERLHAVYFLEAFFIFGAALSNHLLKHSGWQDRWIDYRYLAERLRATCYLRIANMELEPAPEHPDSQIHWLPAGWVTLALRGVWAHLDRHRSDERFNDPAQVRALGQFIFHSWIDKQEQFYFDSHKKNERKNKFFERVSIALLSISFAIAVLYGLSAISKTVSSLVEPLAEYPHVLATIFPAITGALAGIMVFRHYSRNSERYLNMSTFLNHIGTDILAAAGPPNRPPDLQELRIQIGAADAAMSHEHEGWRTVFGVRLPGPG